MVTLGREHELAAVERFVAGAAEAPSVLVLRGAAGIGKTTVWRAGLQAAADRGMAVVSSRPTPTEASLAYGGLADLLDPFKDLTSRLPPPQRRALRVALVLADPGPTPPDERAVAAAAASLLQIAAARQPLLVAVDDLQWLDLSSWTAVHFAARRAAEEGVRLLATMREGVATAVDVDGAEIVELGPLSTETIDRILREQQGMRLSRPALERVAAVSGGNPFFAVQLCHALKQDGHSVDPTAPLAVPPSLSGLLEERLRRIPARVRRALLVAALARDATLELVCTVADVDESDLDLAVAAGVVDPTGDTLRFSHPLFGEALHAAASVAERQHAHRELARLVADPEERARHVAGSATGPDEEAAATLQWAAARARQRGAPMGAAELGELGLTLTPPDLPELHARRLAAADAHDAAGNAVRAEVLLREAIEEAGTPSERAEAMWRLARLEDRLPEEEAIALLRRALELAQREPALLAGIHKSLAFHLQELDRDPIEAERHAEAAVGIAESLTDPYPLTMALSALGRIRHRYRGHIDHALFERALALEERCTDIAAGDRPRLIYALALMDTDEVERARTLLLEVIDLCAERGQWDIANPLLYLSFVERSMGRWSDAWSHANESAIVCEQFGRDTSGPLAWRSSIEFDLGDEDAARSTALAVTGTATDDERWWVASAQSVLAAIELDHGRPHEALALTEEPHVPEVVWYQRARALVALDRLDEARALADTAEASPYNRLPRTLVRLALARALIYSAEGDHAAALTACESALPHAVARPFDRACLLLASGSARRRLHQKAAARSVLNEAVAIFDGLGAKGWAAKARTEADLVPGRRSQPGKLTPVEDQIARLVARGRSNAEVARELYLSPKTVEWNLSKVYRKLSVRSRAELAAKLARR